LQDWQRELLLYFTAQALCHLDTARGQDQGSPTGLQPSSSPAQGPGSSQERESAEALLRQLEEQLPGAKQLGPHVEVYVQAGRRVLQQLSGG
jgi:hypothetical protein